MSWVKFPEDGVTFDKLLDKEELDARPAPNWSAEELYHHLLGKIGFPADKESWEKWLDDWIEKHGLPSPDDLQDDGSADGDLSSELSSRVWASRLARAQAGDKTGGLLRELAGDFPTPRTPWPQVLRSYLQDAVMPQTRENFNRPGRRVLSLDSSFFEPSFQSERGIRRIGVAVDTSGSIDQGILARFATEIEAVQKRTGAELYVVVCDAEVTGEFAVPAYGRSFTQRVKAGELEFKGGGGTAFQPAIERLNKTNVKIALYLTDMCGPFGDVKPQMPFIWCSTMEGIAAPFGRVIFISIRWKLNEIWASAFKFGRIQTSEFILLSFAFAAFVPFVVNNFKLRFSMSENLSSSDELFFPSEKTLEKAIVRDFDALREAANADPRSVLGRPSAAI